MVQTQADRDLRDRFAFFDHTDGFFDPVPDIRRNLLFYCGTVPVVSGGDIIRQIDPVRRQDLSVLNPQDGHGNVLAEPAGPAAAGIEEQGAADLLHGKTVGMAVDNDIIIRDPAGDICLFMGHEEADSLQRKIQSIRNLLRPVPVVVAPYHIERCHFPQSVHDFLPADIPAMEDIITAGQLFQDRGAQQVMSIGDDSGSDHSEGLISIYESIH